MEGKVYLVGAGPGTAGLLTLQAKRLLSRADAVVYDRLLTPRLLNFAPQSASAYYVGKEAHHHSLPQREIESLLIRLAQDGKRVVRLKGGDPFVYGRGGEEAMALRAAGIAFEVVPGVTSATSVPAYAGIPVTHRQVATSFTVITGHEMTEQDGEVTSQDALYPSSGTLVILMGVAQLSKLVAQQLAAGRSPTTPVAVVRSGTLGAQATIVARLGTIVDAAAAANITSPAIIIIGDVVSLREEIAWAESRPLFGKRILICSEASDTSSACADEVEDLGGEAFDICLPHLAASLQNDPSVAPGLQALAHNWDLTKVDAVWVVPWKESANARDSDFTSNASQEWFERWMEKTGLPQMARNAMATRWQTAVISTSIESLIDWVKTQPYSDPVNLHTMPNKEVIHSR